MHTAFAPSHFLRRRPAPHWGGSGFFAQDFFVKNGTPTSKRKCHTYIIAPFIRVSNWANHLFFSNFFVTNTKIA
jgi:hypothetical protein